MYFNGYSVRVVGGREVQDGYVIMKHGDTYELAIRNNSSLRCNARVEIDGTEVGVFRILSYSTILLERPANDTGKFTFYKAGSGEAEKIGLSLGNSELGLISVRFTPELVPVQHISYTSNTQNTLFKNGSTEYKEDLYPKSVMCSCFAGQSISAGGTGLSGKSNQSFVEAGRMILNHDAEVTINLRLVSDNTDEPRPLRPTSTSIPPMIY